MFWDGFRLLDLAEAAMANPPREPLPKLGAKRAAAQGALMRLLILDDHTDDADLWVAITARAADDCFIGKIHETDAFKKDQLIA